MSSWLKFVQIFSCRLSPRKELHGPGFLLGGGNTLMLRVHYVRWFFGWDEPLIGHFEINANLVVNSYGGRPTVTSNTGAKCERRGWGF